MRGRSLGAAALAAALLTGCKGGADDEYAPAILPKTYAFEGKADPKYVGKWVSTDGTSTLDLAADGGAKIDTVTRSQQGKSTAHVEGKWLATQDSLLFQYDERSGGITVLKDSAKLDGNTLVLQQAGGKIKTTYRRK